MLHHVIRGRGDRPVFLVHGFLGSGRNLGMLARGWGQANPELRFVMPDLLGHGRSPSIPAGGSLDDMAMGLVRLADELGIEQLDIVGHSLGGRVGLAARRVAPERMGRLVLLDIRPGRIETTDTEQVVAALVDAPARADSRDAMRRVLEAKGLSRGLCDWLLMSGDADDDGFSWRVDREGLADFHRRMRGEDLWDQVSGETALIRGGNSTYVDEADVEAFRSRGCFTETIPGAGHFLHVDQTEKVVAAVAASFEA